CSQQERAVAIWRAVVPGHPEYGIGISNLAAMYILTGRRAEAEPLLREALPILERSLGTDDTRLVSDMTNYSGALRASKRKAEAKQIEQRIKVLRGQAGLAGASRRVVDVADLRA